jgi:hypothetical protein
VAPVVPAAPAERVRPDSEQPSPIPPSPTAPPSDLIVGEVRWTVANGPIRVARNLVVARGGALLIDPGVEVQIAPGASIFVEGALVVRGTPDRHVRLVGVSGQRWDGIFGSAGSVILFDQAEIHDGGSGGTLLSSNGGRVTLSRASISRNYGHIDVTDGPLDVVGVEIANNAMPAGAALQASYSFNGAVRILDSAIYNNGLARGGAAVQIANQEALSVVSIDMQRNTLISQAGPNVELFANGNLQGSITCNALVQGTNGISLHSQAPLDYQLGLLIRDNAIERHTPPILPFYIENGIGRGATSEIGLDMRGNWWRDASGPYAPDRHADGRGEAVGHTIQFDPWLKQRPACAPPGPR